MKLALIGVGQAGGKIVDAFIEYENRTGTDIFRLPVAVNTAEADLQGLSQVPSANRILIGQSRVKGHGVGADNELGAEVARADGEEIQQRLDAMPVHEVDAFLVVAGLGGGTGSGAGPVIASQLKERYTEPVFGLGVLPGTDEGGIYTLNAARSFRTFVREVDNLLVFDNDAWRQSGESVRDGFETINEEIARRFGILFGAGEVSAGDAVAESVVDASEIINTLMGGGVSTVGYATEEIERASSSRLSLFGDDDGEDPSNTTNRITSLVRKATLGRLTLPCEIEGADRSLVVVSGPPASLSRKGVARARKWLEDETGSMEVRGGDYPVPDSEYVAGVVLLSGVHQIPRVKQLQQVAVEAQDSIDQREADHEDNLAGLLEDGSEELSPLF